MGYADLDEAARRLNLTEAHAAELAQLAVLDAALSAVFDAAAGRTFDGSAAAVERTVEAPGVSDLLVLPVPVLTVTGVVVGGAWDGATWIGATTLDADGYRLRFGDAASGWRAIELAGGVWGGAVRITGTWGDDPGEDAGAAVADLLTHAVTLEYRRRTGAPDQAINELLDGAETPTPSIFSDPLWKRVVALHRVEHRALVV